MRETRGRGSWGWCLLAGLTVLATIVAACGEPDPNASDADPNVSTGTVVQTKDGFRSVSIPLSERGRPLVLGAGRKVIVYGGIETGSGKNLIRPLGDGSVFDLDSGAWSDLPPAPFSAPLYLPAGVWTGAEMILAGTPCGENTGDTDTAACDPGGFEAAAYSPERNTWRKLESPDISQHRVGGRPGSYPTEPSAVGWTQDQAVFRMSINAADNLLMVNPETEHWQWATDPPRTYGACATGGELIAVDTGVLDEQGQGVSPDPAAATKPLRTQRYDAAKNSWTPVSAIAKPDSVNSIFEKVVCTAGRLAYLPVKNASAGLDGGGLWFDPARLQWDPLPSFDNSGFPGPMLVADSGGTKVLLFGTSDQMRILPTGADKWVKVFSPVAPELTGFRAIDGAVLMTGKDVSGQAILGILEPERYAQVGGSQPPPTRATKPFVPLDPRETPAAGHSSTAP